MSTWPSTLPQSAQIKAYSQSANDNVIRSTMGYGPAKLRRRTTTIIQTVNIVLTMTDTQKDTLITFYGTTLSDGTLEFDWTDHLNSGTVSYRFTAPIMWSSYGGDLWNATLALEIVP